MAAKGGLDAIGGDQQVAAVIRAIGEPHAGLVALLLHAGGALVEPRHTLGQVTGQHVQEIRAVHRGLPHARRHAGADVAGIAAAAPFEPHILPRLRSPVGDLPIGLGQPETGNGPDRVGAEGNARAHFTEGRGGFEQLDVEV
ncbi:hypothetical protein FQZ97_1140250 [compost metagenome]